MQDRKKHRKTVRKLTNVEQALNIIQTGGGWKIWGNAHRQAMQFLNKRSQTCKQK